MYTRSFLRSFFWFKWIQSTPNHPVSIRFILILSFYLRLGLPSVLFPSGLQIKMLYSFLMSPYVLYAPPVSWLHYTVIYINYLENKSIRHETLLLIIWSQSLTIRNCKTVIVSEYMWCFKLTLGCSINLKYPGHSTLLHGMQPDKLRPKIVLGATDS
jgi:hypothetical protein